SQDVIGTYFIQTKYIRDYNDDIFFDDRGIIHLKKLAELGMEIGSHTVAHSRLFSQFPMGTGSEQYPTYAPFVNDRKATLNWNDLRGIAGQQVSLGTFFRANLDVVSARRT